MAQEPPQGKGRLQKQQLTGAVRHAQSGTAHMHRDVAVNKFLFGGLGGPDNKKRNEKMVS